MNIKNKTSKKLKAVSYITAVLLSAALNFNVQAAGDALEDARQAFNYQRERAAIQLSHQVKIFTIEGYRTARLDGELAYEVKKGFENLSYFIRIGALDAGYAMCTSATHTARVLRTGARDIARELGF